MSLMSKILISTMKKQPKFLLFERSLPHIPSYGQDAP